MDQVHTQTEGRKMEAQHQHMFPQTWIKFTYQLRAEKHNDSISTVSTDINEVHTPTEGRKTQAQHQHTFPQTCIKFTHLLSTGKHTDNISTSFYRHGSSSHTS